MQMNFRSRVYRMAIAAVVGSGLFFAVSAQAESDEGNCSDISLRGEFGFLATGALLGVPGLPAQAPFQSVGIARFDGKGHLSWVEHTIVNGQPLSIGFVAASGTYTVGPNCTGTAIVNTPNARTPVSFALVIVKNGKEINTVNDGNAITAVYQKVD